MRELFWTIIVEGKEGLQVRTNFDFKHIPALYKFTVLERSSYSGQRKLGVERRNLCSFLLLCSLLMWIVSLGLYRLASLRKNAHDTMEMQAESLSPLR